MGGSSLERGEEIKDLCYRKRKKKDREKVPSITVCRPPSNCYGE